MILQPPHPQRICLAWLAGVGFQWTCCACLNKNVNLTRMEPWDQVGCLQEHASNWWGLWGCFLSSEVVENKDSQRWLEIANVKPIFRTGQNVNTGTIGCLASLGLVEQLWECCGKKMRFFFPQPLLFVFLGWGMPRFDFNYPFFLHFSDVA